MLESQGFDMMRQIANLVFCLIFSAISVNGCAAPAIQFGGEWEWVDAPSTMEFSVALRVQRGKIQGQYCAVAHNGARIDCSDINDPNIEGVIDKSAQSATLRFSSFFGAKNGLAHIKIVNGNLDWRIISNPDGNFYAPKNAVLKRR